MKGKKSEELENYLVEKFRGIKDMYVDWQSTIKPESELHKSLKERLDNLMAAHNAFTREEIVLLAEERNKAEQEKQKKEEQEKKERIHFIQKD